MKKDLLTTVKEKLEKRGLVFELKRECNDKFKGTLIQKETGASIPFEISKMLQANRIESFCDNAEKSFEMYIFFTGERMIRK